MKLHQLIIVIILILTLDLEAQEMEQVAPTFIGKVGSMTYVPSIASRLSTLTIASESSTKEIQDGRSSRAEVIPGKDPQKEDDSLAKYPHPLSQKLTGRSPNLVFDAVAANSNPLDPSLAVGPDHVFVVYNTGFIIYDKNGVAQSPQLTPNPSIFPNSGCCDLTATYDKVADRWIISFLNGVNLGAQVAISDGTSADPLLTGWFVYFLPQIRDYQKLSLWHDGYYMTDNNFSNKVWALERDKMLLGDPNAQVIGFPLPGMQILQFNGQQALNISDDNFPNEGPATVIYYQDDAWAGVSYDHLKLWSVDVDWETPGNSSVSPPSEIILTPFISTFDGGSYNNLTQPGGTGVDMDALTLLIMNQAQFRKFETHNSAVFNFVVDSDAGPGERAAVRWYELRQTDTTEPWSIYQEGTFLSPNKHAWGASLIMDVQGNIGMGFSAMSMDPNDPNPIRVSSYYTGRHVNDPLNTMTVAEEVIYHGTANFTTIRYGDYFKIDVDPVNDRSFWHITSYMNPNRKAVVGVFDIAPILESDVGAVLINSPLNGELSADETVQITLYNYGSTEQSNFPVSLYVDGLLIVEDFYTETIAAASSGLHSFSMPVDLSNIGQTYELEVRTTLLNDEDNSNDSEVSSVTHILVNDVGVVEIISPVSSEELGDEIVTVAIENFGSAIQSNFDLSYVINGGTALIENFESELQPGAVSTYSFSTLAELSSVGSFEISAATLLSTDGQITNDTTTVTVDNFPLSIEDNMDEVGNLIVMDQGDNQFRLELNTVKITNRLTLQVLNVHGQILTSYRIDNLSGNGYIYDLNMSFVDAGIYIVQIGDENYSGVRRIVVD